MKALRKWKIPAVILLILIMAFAFRWDNLGSSTKEGVITKTSQDRWNGAIWQTTIKNGSYEEKIIQPSWVEAGRPKVDKQIEVQEPVYAERQSEYFNFTIKELVDYKTVTKTIKVPPEQLYWTSRNGLTKIWAYLTAIVSVWLITSIGIMTRDKKRMVKSEGS